MTESTMADQKPSAEELAELNREFETAPAGKVDRVGRRDLRRVPGPGRLLRGHRADRPGHQGGPGIEVIFLDTEAHFPETLAFVEEIRARYGLNLTVTKPGPEAAAHPCGSEQCCQFRKVAPLARPSREAGPG